MTSRIFWAMIRPFLTNKGMVTSNQTLLKQENDVINNEGKVAKFLNNGYINVVENSTGKEPLSVLDEDTLLVQQQLILSLKNANITQVY